MTLAESVLPLRPFTLGPFLVGPDGVLSPRVAGGRPAFTFRWRGRAFQAELQGRHLVIGAAIAGLPFAAESAAARPAVLAALQAARAALAPHWRLALPPGARVQLQADADLDRPPTALRMITAAAQFAWQVTPYLELLEEAGAVEP
jgi:hypothetical protein